MILKIHQYHIVVDIGLAVDLVQAFGSPFALAYNSDYVTEINFSFSSGLLPNDLLPFYKTVIIDLFIFIILFKATEVIINLISKGSECCSSCVSLAQNQSAQFVVTQVFIFISKLSNQLKYHLLLFISEGLFLRFFHGWEGAT